MSDNPFKDSRVEVLLAEAGINGNYQWLHEINPDRSVDRNSGSVDVYSEQMTSDEMIGLLKKVNNGHPVKAEKSKTEWNTGDFIRFYVSFNDKGEWHIP